MSVRWLYCIDHADKYSKAGRLTDYLLSVVPQPTDNRLSETILSPDKLCYHERHDGLPASYVAPPPSGYDLALPGFD